MPFENTQISNYMPYMLNIMLLAVNLDLVLHWMHTHACKMKLGELRGGLVVSALRVEVSFSECWYVGHRSRVTEKQRYEDVGFITDVVIQESTAPPKLLHCSSYHVLLEEANGQSFALSVIYCFSLQTKVSSHV